MKLSHLFKSKLWAPSSLYSSIVLVTAAIGNCNSWYGIRHQESEQDGKSLLLQMLDTLHSIGNPASCTLVLPEILSTEILGYISHWKKKVPQLFSAKHFGILYLEVFELSEECDRDNWMLIQLLLLAVGSVICRRWKNPDSPFILDTVQQLGPFSSVKPVQLYFDKA